MGSSFKSHLVCNDAEISLRCDYFNFYLMTLFEFTEGMPGQNRVRYPISGRNDFTVLLGSVVDRHNYIYEKYPLYTIYDAFL